MDSRVMNFRKRFAGTFLALILAGVSLAGCVVYPGYGYGYAPAYYAPPVSFGFGYYGGERHDWR